MRSKFHWLVCISLILGVTVPGALADCLKLNESDRTRLTQYVQKKQRLPRDLAITLAEDTIIDSTCYRKLLFKAQASRRTARFEFFLSPDLRFLSRELLDSTQDPLKEEQQQQQVLIDRLTHGNFPSLGPRDAPVSITIFSDFQCPACARMSRMLSSQILPAEKNRIRLVFRHFPLPSHLWARPAAEAAACAHEQGDRFFWSLHDFMFARQQTLTIENLKDNLVAHGRTLKGLDLLKFETCVAGRKMSSRVEQDLQFGLENGLNSTPSVFVNHERIKQLGGPEQILTLVRQLARAEPAPRPPIRP